MLVLSRKSGERIKIGDNVWITVVEVKRGVVRLGIEAPRDVSVMRSELLVGDRRAKHSSHEAA
jgi:carbon storage regulator